MIRSLILRPPAEKDVRETYDALEQLRTGLGAQFNLRLRKTLERIEVNPEMYGFVWQDVRAARLRHFRYVVYYVVQPDEVAVIGVLHGARDSTIWKLRA